ncbi:cytosolic Fe-S cluster assembly factor NUBP2 homolog [Ctenocephalides felis]|uniref:cytosolic Fe-S cluster assembly factor NUBP2 homolog n=1 Tax=Ctenocephalides felis TaxID=7515 RepID=UPI000E6E38DF|nr:cytosolic Fe-S cluster assembly factor NUBP2 homolog [Ctenocephalides felis]XP_026470178.1 cytosolic Fe-S cluster assembly factor NUBP2 homolog [Ctenocephalides felis]
MLSGVKHIFLVLSGKGGVGKSTVSTQLALTLKEQGYKVGILDIDLCGPSVPFLLNIEDAEVCQCPEGWLPVYTDENKNLAVMSIAFLLKSRNDSIVWRGPKKTSMIRQFINDVYWNEIDYLIIDTPPGTSDEHITVMECLKEVDFDGAVIVTSPQEISLEDVRKEITFCKKTGIKILGVIENLSGYECPNCSECTNIFSSGGGAALAELASVPFLGTLPIEPRLSFEENRGKSVLSCLPDSTSCKAFSSIVQKLTN